MIAADTSSMAAYLKGEDGADTDLIDSAARYNTLALPAVVVTELMSDPDSAAALSEFLPDTRLLAITDGYWQRAGHSRQMLKIKGLKAKIADTLIAQSCIDHDIPLIARDQDFRHFAEHCGLKLA